VSCSCVGCECLPNGLSNVIAPSFGSQYFFRNDREKGRLRDSFGTYSWLYGGTAGNSMHAFGGAGWNHVFSSTKPIKKGKRKGKHTETINKESKLFYATWICTGDCPKADENSPGDSK
jgi:hypothetical protein